VTSIGATVTPMSGAGSIKGDGFDADTMYEVKDAAKQYVLKGSDLDKLYREAVRDGRSPAMLVTFENGLTAVIQPVKTASLTKYRRKRRGR
jgi:hypothetical protein